MKFYALVISAFIAGCSPAKYTIEEVTEYAGQAPDEQSAISIVTSFIEANDHILSCRNANFSAVEVRTTTSFKEVKLGDKQKRTNTKYVDEWGVEEIVFDGTQNSSAARYWSVNGRTGTVELVGGSGFIDGLETCSVSN